jgi:glycosyltransferase involved in cell wall biosynthesis
MRRPQYSSIFYNLGYILQAAWQARRWRSDIIHVHNFSQFVPAIRLLNPAASIVLHMNCEWLSQHEHAMIGRRVKKADAIICCSNHVKEELLERFPECRAKSHVVFNGVNIEHFLPGERRLDEMSAEARILFVGRVSPEKGVHVLIEAFTKVACQVPNVFLDVVGGGGSLPLDYLVAISSDRVVRGLGHFYGTDYLTVVKSRIPVKLRTRVVFHGNVEHDALAGHYRKATVFASPSLSDAFPLTVVEAMSAGLPIVASAVGGIREAVVDGETGLLVEPDNPNALAEALTRLLVDADTRNRIGTAARARAVELFSWKAISEQVVRIYAAVEGSNGRAYGRHRGAI